MRPLLAAALLFVLPAAHAQGGALDPTFGTDGRVTTNVGSGLDFIVGLAEQPDGRLLAVGTSNDAGLERPALVRYLPDGTLDASFGAAGVVIHETGGVRGQLNSVAVLASGQILVAGYARLAANNDAVFLARYTASGTLDATFGSGGVLSTPYTGRFTEIVELPDGRLLLSGPLGQAAPYQSSRASVVRMTADGALDASFGAGGRASLPTIWGGLVPMALDGDGRIVFSAGLGSSAPGGGGALVARLTAEGQLDPAFGTAGVAEINLTVAGEETREASNDLVVDDAGRILFVGRLLGATAQSPINDGLIVRLTPTGALDASFGSGGAVVVDRAGTPEGLSGVARLADGQYYAAGTSRTDTGGNDFFLVRFSPEGALDATFGVGGSVTTDFASGSDEGQAMLHDASGRLVVGGYASTSLFALARYLPAVAVAAEPAAPASALRLSVAPNPSAAPVALLHLDAGQPASVVVLDALGRRVAVLHDGALGAGTHRFALPALPAGAYHVRATTAAGTATSRLSVVR